MRLQKRAMENIINLVGNGQSKLVSHNPHHLHNLIWTIITLGKFMVFGPRDRNLAMWLEFNIHPRLYC